MSTWQTISFVAKSTSHKKPGAESPVEGIIVMAMHVRPLRLALLLPGALLLGMGQARAQQDHAHMDMSAGSAPAVAMKQLRWSDPATWPNGRVPRAGDAVTIGRDMDVLLDVDAPGLRSLTIQGRMRFADTRDTRLETEWIYVPGGELQIGTQASPYRHNASITLTDTVKGEDINTMGDRGIMMLGGTLNLHGDRAHTWTKLAKTAKAGASSITVLDAKGWRKGDEIVLASTDFNPRQAERRTIVAVSGNSLTLDKPLQYMHFGEITFGVDERGEVAMLSRNIKIQASEDAAKTYFGGHIMAMAGSKMYVDSVELNRMGQHLTLARYPIHFHVLGEGQGMYVRNAAIHDTFNRCVTVHGTNNLKVENNVTYNTVGHCFFLEDGIEHGNAFIKNLAIQTKCHPTLDCVPTNLAANGERGPNYADRQAYSKMSFHGGNTLLPSDNTVASFWITNPDNSFIDNVAAGSDENGFWMSLPEHPQGAFKDSEQAKTIWPRRTPLRAFRGNVAHSNFDGFMFDRNIYTDNTFGLATIPLLPLKNPADLESDVVESHFENLTSYKNRNGGLWGRGDMFVYSNAKFADNAIGMTQAAGDIGSNPFNSRLVDSLVVGETGNIGNPTTPEEIAYGRSLPKPKLPDFPIRGYEYYDYRDDVVNTTFVNYQDNAVRKTGALSFLLFTSAGLSTGSTISGAKFVNAKPVYFPKYDARFDNDNRGGNAYRTLSFRDLDGSVTGIPNSQVLLNDGENDSVVTDDSCEIHPSWNASVCTGDIGRLNLSDATGELPKGVDLDSRTARYALLSSLGPDAPDTPLTKAQRAALFSRRPQQAPIALVRNGKEFKISGDQSTVRAGTEILVKTERPEVTLSLAEMDKGSWVMFELPGFTKAASGTQQASMDALRKANETSYFRDGDALWVKLVAAAPIRPVIRPTDLQASITVSREGPKPAPAQAMR
jgi:cell migration-inducing and hyaluronan-binding protein